MDVEAGAADLAGVERREQSRLVDQAAAGDVDEDRARLHGGEGGGVEHVRVGSVIHRAADDGVCLAERIVELVGTGDLVDPSRRATGGLGPYPVNIGGK
ncbi:MAG TPA: hypothetical protein VMA95_01430 [Streptosporangiaceae bacterium]|nr:hypothetical protein [Streptosporangiaceae bacterium]